jgi:hypothetical protein
MRFVVGRERHRWRSIRNRVGRRRGRWSLVTRGERRTSTVAGSTRSPLPEHDGNRRVLAVLAYLAGHPQ